jgi:AraC-like DNA-binding protein
MLANPEFSNVAFHPLSGNDPRRVSAVTERSRGTQQLRPAPRGYADGGTEVREGMLSRLLIDEEESLNSLYNIVNQVGLHISFLDEKERLIGRCGDGAKGDHRAARPERTSRRKPAKMAPSCLAALIFDAGGGLVGFLAVLPTNGNLGGEVSTLARVLRTTARAIEERSFRQRYRGEWIRASASLDGNYPGMLLALDGYQRIVDADWHARSMLAARHVTLESGPTLWAIFEKEAALFGNTNVGDIHAVMLAVGDAQIWAAIVTPPQPSAWHQQHSRPRLDTIGRFSRPAAAGTSVGGLTPRALERLSEYIEAHSTDNIELEALAIMAGLTKWHFARAFKQSIGVPQHFYLIQRRLERAQELLAESDLSLAQIALESGFDDQSHFFRCFRMFFGVTPRSFRRSKQ